MNLSDAAQAGSICGSIIAIAQIMIALGDRLWGNKKNDSSFTQVAANQTNTPNNSVLDSIEAMKFFTHAGEIKELLREQNESLKSLVDTLHDSVHNETLRYELLMAKLREIQNTKRNEY